MDLGIEKEWEFVPETGVNKDDAHPPTFVLKYLTPSQLNKAISYTPEVRNGQEVFVVVYNNDLLFLYGVKEIRNVSLNGKEISKPSDFLKIENPLADKWYKEVCGEVSEKNIVSEADSKN